MGESNASKHRFYAPTPFANHVYVQGADHGRPQAGFACPICRCDRVPGLCFHVQGDDNRLAHAGAQAATALRGLTFTLQGFEKVQEMKKWRELALRLGVPKTCTSATAQLRLSTLLCP